MNIAKAPGIWIPNISKLKLPDVFILYVWISCGIYIKQDNTLDILDVVMDIGYIIGSFGLTQSEAIIADINYDLSVDVLDVVSIVDTVLD